MRKVEVIKIKITIIIIIVTFIIDGLSRNEDTIIIIVIIRHFTKLHFYSYSKL